MAKPDKSEKKDEWRTFTVDQYREVAGNLVHFSAKGVNSNAEPGGVRLDGSAALDLPYVSVRCLMARGVGFQSDYTKNTGTIATVVKQLRKLAGGEHEGAAEEIREHWPAIAGAMVGPHREGIDKVCPRLRQILLPKGDGYVALTPLPSGGLSLEINRRVADHNEAVKTAREAAKDDPARPEHPRPLARGTLTIGGANPVNVGALVQEIRTVLVFDAPRENPDIRAAWSIHYRGIRPGLPRRLMDDWRGWRRKKRAEHGGQLPTDMDSRDEERDLLVAVGRAVLRQGAKARRMLEDQRAQLPGGMLLSDRLDDRVLRGLIDPDERGKDWPRQFGERIARAIADYSFGPKDGVESLDSGSIALIARWLEEDLR